MIEPLNENADDLLDVDLRLLETFDLDEATGGCDENAVIELQWRNATLVMRAGALRAVIERRRIMDA